MDESSFKILWLSDIHFYRLYKTAAGVKEIEGYINSFCSVCNNDHIAEDPFNYILLSGDLSQEGTIEDYIALFEMLLKPIFDLFLEKYKISGIALPKVLAIPGNHDVNWSDTGFLKEYLVKINKDNLSHAERIDFLRTRKGLFECLFKDYTSFLNEYVLKVDGGMYKGFFINAASSEIFISKSYKESKLYGYVIDKKRKLLFVLLNSAWYSLGGRFNKILASQKIFENDFLIRTKKILDWKGTHKSTWNIYKNYFLGNTKKTDDIHDFDDRKDKKKAPAALRHMYEYFDGMLEIKERISESNSQLTGINFIELDYLEREVKLKYNDYFVISVMHHPLNWVHWNEQYSYIDDPNENAIKLNKLLGFSSIFLSGHEHIPHGAPEQKSFKNTLHLKGGCFLFDKQHKSTNFEFSWFSILRIDTNKMLLEQTKNIYNKTLLDWVPQTGGWEKLQKSTVNLTVEKREIILEMLANSSPEKIFNYLKTKGIIGNSVMAKDFSLLPIKNNNFIFYKINVDGKYEFIVFPIRSKVYNNINTKRSIKILDDLVKKYKPNCSIFRFLVLDLLVDEKLNDLYLSSFAKRDDIRDFIFKRADILFDDFRHNFYIRFEYLLNEHNRLPASFIYYKDLKFVNHIIPFWEFEKHWI